MMQDLLEYHCLVTIHNNTVFQMPSYGTCQYITLYVLPQFTQLLYSKVMVYTLYVLLNDWTLVQISRYIVGSRTNQFHTFFLILLVRICTDKRWQE